MPFAIGKITQVQAAIPLSRPVFLVRTLNADEGFDMVTSDASCFPGQPRCALWRITLGALLAVIATGCGGLSLDTPAPLFFVPLSIEDEPVGLALVDTGGSYELMLADNFGLPIVDEVDVLLYTGEARAGVTGEFNFTAGGLKVISDGALVGLNICDCHGVGYPFLRKTGAVFGLDFANDQAAFLFDEPSGGTEIPFAEPPAHMSSFDSAFLDVEITANGASMVLRALLDTGANTTVMRRGLIGTPLALEPDRTDVRIGHDQLGIVAARVGLYDNEALPAMIIGTDVMRAWSSEWYFRFDGTGGAVITFPSGLKTTTVESPPTELRTIACTP